MCRYNIVLFRIGEYGNYPSFWVGLAYSKLEGAMQWTWLDGKKVDTSIT